MAFLTPPFALLPPEPDSTDAWAALVRKQEEEKAMPTNIEKGAFIHTYVRTYVCMYTLLVAPS
jgi:hypothetical protein